MTINVKYSVEVNDETYDCETLIKLDYETLVNLVMEKINADNANIYIGEITLETEPIF